MLRNFLKNRKAQNTAEYALLIALVVAGVIAMQTYAQRALQARIHDASQYMANATSNSSIGLGNSTQYEPYYMQSNYDVSSNSVDQKKLGQGLDAMGSQSERVRTGSENSTYSTNDVNQQ
jgi:Flp pilus assembly pilin Flp